MHTVVQKRWWPFWCWFPWFVVIIVVICCWWWPKVPCPPSFDADLIVLDETTAAWATMNNTFAGGSPSGTVGTTYWTGILFQLGYADAEETYKAVQFWSGGSIVGELFRDDVAWVNIVSEVSGTVDPPMLPDHYALLDGTCTTTAGCAHCLRLDAGLVPSTVITYWQGPSGFAVEAEQKTGSYTANNEQRFDFKDKFTVTCYKVDSSGTPTPISGFTFGPGAIDEIRITHEPGPPGGGVKESPPWPGP